MTGPGDLRDDAFGQMMGGGRGVGSELERLRCPYAHLPGLARVDPDRALRELHAARRHINSYVALQDARDQLVTAIATAGVAALRDRARDVLHDMGLQPNLSPWQILVSGPSGRSELHLSCGDGHDPYQPLPGLLRMRCGPALSTTDGYIFARAARGTWAAQTARPGPGMCRGCLNAVSKSSFIGPRGLAADLSEDNTRPLLSADADAACREATCSAVALTLDECLKRGRDTAGRYLFDKTQRTDAAFDFATLAGYALDEHRLQLAGAAAEVACELRDRALRRALGKDRYDRARIRYREFDLFSWMGFKQDDWAQFIEQRMRADDQTASIADLYEQRLASRRP